MNFSILSSLGTLAGMVGPLLFLAVFSLEGWLRPGYSPISMFISELSLGTRGWIQVTNFFVYGVLLLIFAVALVWIHNQRDMSLIGPLVIGLIAICLLASGYFATDPSGTTVRSTAGLIHSVFGAIAFALMPISCFLFLNSNRYGGTFNAWTLVAGIIIAVSVILLSIAIRAPSAKELLVPWIGLIQRGALVPHMLWLVMLAVETRKNLNM